jgi:hypothetical protein
MRKLLLAGMVVVLVLSVLFSFGAQKAQARVPALLEFSTMVGLPRPFTGALNAIRSVPGGGLPWAISSAMGELNTNGKLEISVRGLVLAEGANTGKNPIANFRAIVSCLSKDASGNPITVNVSTGLFPADLAGNSNIEETLSLPKPCIAPIIFVTSPAGSWFAATGN